jgi:hypothetical protein
VTLDQVADKPPGRAVAVESRVAGFGIRIDRRTRVSQTPASGCVTRGLADCDCQAADGLPADELGKGKPGTLGVDRKMQENDSMCGLP